MTIKLTESLKKEIKQQFIEGYVDENNKRVFPFVEQLAEKFNVARATLYRHSTKDDWQSQKNKFHTKIEVKTTEKKVNEFVKASSRLDESALNIAQGLLNSVGMKLQKAMDEHRTNPNYVGLPNSELREMSNTAMNAQKIGKLALGEAQEINKVTANVATSDDFRGLINQIQQINRARSEKANHTYQ